MKRAWAVLLVTLVVVLPARLYAVFNFVDLKTGFYTDDGKLAGIVAGVTALGVIFVMVFGRRSLPKYQHAPLRSVPTAVFAALSGVFIAGESLVNLAGPDGLTVMNGLLALFGVCAAVSFLVAAYDFAAGETVLRQHPMVALLEPLWGCLCLISLFVSYSSKVNSFENIYHTFTVALLVLFLFSQTKLLSGIDEEGGMKVVFSYGFAAAIAALTDAIPNLALLFEGRKTLGIFSTGLHLANIFLAVYILVFLAEEGRRRISAPMVAITPEPSGSNTTVKLENQSQEKQDDGAVEKSETDQLPVYLDFLQKAYQCEDKFVENGKHDIKIVESIKS